MKFEESEFYQKWAVSGMPKDKQRLAQAAWEDGNGNECRLVSYAPDGSTCTINLNGEEIYLSRESENLK